MSYNMPLDSPYVDEKKKQFNYKRRALQDRLGTFIAEHRKTVLAVFCALFVLFWFGSAQFSLFSRDPKIVLILAVNDGGGVHKWKGEQEWAIERISIQNKRAYAKRHGYGLTIKDLRTAKRYSHEYREGWQKVEILRQTMREFPNAEWFWWLDPETLIMEPQLSLEKHLFKRLDSLSYRILDDFNPLQLPLDIPYVDYSQEPELYITQDCGGFNLGSFFVKNSEWTKLLLDVWWDPVCYEQKHMLWEHREQDALEALYANEPWIREKTAFLPLRSINSFPSGACSEFSDDARYFYSEEDRDFVVNMAGCSFGRDCWGEMQHYGSIMESHAKRWWRRMY
ncbi:LADA_0D06216g1_1 [Lachancea dasiensis]|uniref:LADA_0D06216g1_1 n=1 Tax=Lachancea dasiensis TaxID=1072105 RepID=A0A1G4J5W8_9SACH|nr:LADA_0D06216g1_1 [Lachancea dasiensis]